MSALETAINQLRTYGLDNWDKKADEAAAELAELKNRAGYCEKCIRENITQLRLENAEARKALELVTEPINIDTESMFNPATWYQMREIRNSRAASAFLAKHPVKGADTMITCSKCGLYHSIYDKECPPF
jgi:hypothetical protein